MGNEEMMEELLYAIAIMAVVVILLILVRLILTGRKLAKHQNEWNERKKKCVAEGMDFLRTYDEYIRYINDLASTEMNSFLGCCFPRF